MAKQTILATGGLGYIGSHTVVKLLQSDYEIVVIDNLSNSNIEASNRIETITGKRPSLIIGDIRNRNVLRRAFAEYHIDAVIHFAGLKAVGESQSNPLMYYDNNVNGSLVLIEEMKHANVKTIVFSSSATVYGQSESASYSEQTELNPVNVYGRTKLIIENALLDVKNSDSDWHIALLRYFNPAGAHESGLIGEDPAGTPNNLMPFIAQVAVGKRDLLQVFGDDYDTPDGTGLRDYIHVDDLAAGHLAALKKLSTNSDTLTLNLGTGRPYSVFEMIKAFSDVSGRIIPYEIVERRQGDLAQYYANPELAQKTIGWKAAHGIERMCADLWRWQSQNPNGYA